MFVCVFVCAYLNMCVCCMVKIEAFDNSHFMNQAVSVCHTYHTDSIVSSMACIFDLKNIF